jgi:hypothetical protein
MSNNKVSKVTQKTNGWAFNKRGDVVSGFSPFKFINGKIVYVTFGKTQCGGLHDSVGFTNSCVIRKIK